MTERASRRLTTERDDRRARRATATPTAPTRSRSWRASRPSDGDPACTSAPPTSGACTTSCGRSSTTPSTRRWPATPRTSRSTIQADGSIHNVGQRTRRAGRQAEADRQGRPRGGAHRAPRGRQVRRWRLQGLRRPPRRGRERRQRPLGVAARSSPRATARSGAQEYARGKPTGPVKLIGPSNGRRGTTTMFMPDAEVFETVDFNFDTIAQRLRESAYLNRRASTSASSDERVEPGTREELPLRGRHRQLRPPPQQGQGRPRHAAHRHRPARGIDLHRGRHPVQRQLLRDGPCLC